MKAADIPFADHIGIVQKDDDLSLDPNKNVMNHLKTVHAGAQFALAETQSGIYLQTLFPELAGKAVPVLRDARIKYKKLAATKVLTFASTDKDAVKKFREVFDKKGRGLLNVNVDVKDINGLLTAQATFTWFIQSNGS